MTTYYVDVINGNDGATGTTKGEAWQTIAKVNASIFIAGDFILFKRGETWTAETLTISWSGSAANFIQFGAYGSGDKPIIDGNNAVNNCIWCAGCSYIRFENIHVRRGIILGFGIGETGGGNPSHHIDLVDCEADGCGDDNVSFENRVHDCTITNLLSYNPIGGAPEAAVTCLEIADECYNITVDGAELYGSPQDGISIHAHAGEELPYNIVLQNIESYNNTRYGADIVGLNGSLSPSSPDIQFIECSFYDNSNVNVNVTQQGMGPMPSNLTFDQCLISGSPIGYYQVSIRGNSHKITRCIIIGVQRGLIINNATDLECYNNTVYLPSGAAFPPIVIYGSDNSGSIFRNNIFSVDVTGISCIQVFDGAHVGLDIDYNLYYTPDGPNAMRWNWRGSSYTWSDWKSNSGQDANSPIPANPVFINAADDNFYLSCDSPAIDAGIDVGFDYSGDAPDCGVFEYEYLPIGTYRVWKPDGKPEQERISWGRFAVWLDVPRCPE